MIKNLIEDTWFNDHHSEIFTEFIKSQYELGMHF